MAHGDEFGGDVEIEPLAQVVFSHSGLHAVSTLAGKRVVLVNLPRHVARDCGFHAESDV